MSFEVHEVSVVIPLYNAEKFIIATLHSLEDQTFQDFEVIVVDDCGTDQSLKFVRNFKSNSAIGSHMKIITLDKNTGPSNARNIGIRQARGKYILFLDSDDALVPEAIETFVDIANKNDADVVHTHEHFMYPENGQLDGEKLNPFSFESGNPDRKAPAYLLTDDLSIRVDDFTKIWIDWNVWGKLFRRDFLVEHNIVFPPMKMTEDMIFSFQCVMQARRYVMIPDVLYIYRKRTGSTLHGERDYDFLHKVIGVELIGSKFLNDFMADHEYFKSHPDDRDKVMDFFFKVEMLATRFVQRHYLDDKRYIERVQKIYADYVGDEMSHLLAFLHQRANLLSPKTTVIMKPEAKLESKPEAKAVDAPANDT